MTDQEIDQVIKQAIDPSASHHARVALIPMLVAAIRAPQPKVKPLVWSKVGCAYWTAEGASGEYEVIQQEAGCTVEGPGICDIRCDEANAKSMADKANAAEVASWLDLGQTE